LCKQNDAIVAKRRRKGKKEREKRNATLKRNLLPTALASVSQLIKLKKDVEKYL
jgi:hypothetical protein